MPFSHINWKDKHLHGFFKLCRLLGIENNENALRSAYEIFRDTLDPEMINVSKKAFNLIDQFRQPDEFEWAQEYRNTELYSSKNSLIEKFNSILDFTPSTATDDDTQVFPESLYDLQQTVNELIDDAEILNIKNNGVFSFLSKKALGKLPDEYQIQFDNETALWVIDTLFSIVYLRILNPEYLVRTNFIEYNNAAQIAKDDNLHDTPLRYVDYGKNALNYSMPYGLDNLGCLYACSLQFIFNNSCVSDDTTNETKQILATDLYAFSALASFYLTNCCTDDGYYNPKLNNYRNQNKVAYKNFQYRDQQNEFQNRMFNNDDSVLNKLNKESSNFGDFIENQLSEPLISQIKDRLNIEPEISNHELAENIINHWKLTVDNSADDQSYNFHPTGHKKTKLEAMNFKNSYQCKKIVLVKEEPNREYRRAFLDFSLATFKVIPHSFFRAPVRITTNLNVTTFDGEITLSDKKGRNIIQAFATYKFNQLCKGSNNNRTEHSEEENDG